MNSAENKTTLDPHFNKMLSLAEEYFASSNIEKYKYHQCLVLNAANCEDRIYYFYSDSIDELSNKCCALLLQEKMPIIKRIVCMFEDGSLNPPAYQFMKNLCKLNIENSKAEILLKTFQNTYVKKRICDIIGCF